jgi:hypothetical protein
VNADPTFGMNEKLYQRQTNLAGREHTRLDIHYCREQDVNLSRQNYSVFKSQQAFRFCKMRKIG